MSKQYVFFRDSTGSPAKREGGKHVPNELLADMGKTSILQDDGRVAWQGWPLSHDALFSTFVVMGPDGNELNERDARAIVWRAMGDVAKNAVGEPLKANEVLKAADARAAEHFRQTVNGYVLVTSLSVKSFPAKRIRICGCDVSPLAKREPRYPLPEILKSGEHRSHFANHLQNSSYQLVKVTSSGRTISEGLGNSLRGLNLLRALWSFGATLGRRSMRLGSGPRKPIGVIHAGPVHTLHHLDGRPVDEGLYWFDPEYTRDQDIFREDGKWSKLESDRKWATRKLAALPYHRDLEEILLRYIGALDEASPNVAVLQLWGILERITNTVGARYDETIDRACWVFVKSDRKLMKETLESLRHHRNRYVHAGNAGNESEEITYRIKSFVDPHIVRLLNNTLRVKSIQEYGEFLSYPTNVETLERMRNWSTRALRVAREDQS